MVVVTLITLSSSLQGWEVVVVIIFSSSSTFSSVIPTFSHPLFLSITLHHQDLLLPIITLLVVVVLHPPLEDRIEAPMPLLSNLAPLLEVISSRALIITTITRDF